MKSQHTQSAHSQGDWDRGRSETDPRTGASGSEYGRPYPRSAPEHYPESQQQYQGQREHPGSGYFSAAPGYGGRSEYSQPQQQGQPGGYRQQEAFQPAGGRQQGFGGEDFGRGGYGGYGREEQGHQFGGQYGMGQQHETQGSQYGRGSFEERPFEAGSHPPQWGETGRWTSGYPGGPGQGSQDYGQQGGQYQGYGGREHMGSAQPQHQAYGGYQQGQPQSYGAAESGQFYAQRGYPSGGQPSGGYGSYGAYQVGSQQAPARTTPRAPKDYVRSDERIRELICESLAHHPDIDASDVSVQVTQGRVSLAGAVPERRMKHEIEDVADACWGVQDVENHIRVQSGQQSALGSAVQSYMAAPADVATGGASTRAATGRTREADMSPTETGTGSAMTGATGSATTAAAVSGKAAGSESRSKGKA